ncbi:hypothetical protein [Flavobacterium sp. JP2137]
MTFVDLAGMRSYGVILKSVDDFDKVLKGSQAMSIILMKLKESLPL